MPFCVQACKELKQDRATTAGSADSAQAVEMHEALLSEPSMCEHYVGLLCQFEPTAVLPFLQSYDSYRYACLIRWLVEQPGCVGLVQQLKSRRLIQTA